jgi:hypothetical protein
MWGPLLTDKSNPQNLGQRRVIDGLEPSKPFRRRDTLNHATDARVEPVGHTLRQHVTSRPQCRPRRTRSPSVRAPSSSSITVTASSTMNAARLGPTVDARRVRLCVAKIAPRSHSFDSCRSQITTTPFSRSQVDPSGLSDRSAERWNVVGDRTDQSAPACLLYVGG